MSNPLSSIITIPTNGIPGTGSTSATSTAESIPVVISSLTTIDGTPVSSAAVGTTLQQTTSTPFISTFSSSTSPTSISPSNPISSSDARISSTSSALLEHTSTSVSSTSTETVNITTIVTAVPGDFASTVTSSLPTQATATLISSPSNSDLVSHRTAIIAGTTTGFIALVLTILGAVFLYRRHKLRKALESSGKKREGRGLLDGEEFDDDERNISISTQSYRSPTHTVPPAASSTLNIMKSRTSETGSIFREEVWPPPGFVDPISNRSSQVDLSGIVDEVMGHHFSPPVPRFTSHPEPPTGPYEPRQLMDTSITSAFSSTSTSPLIAENDPFRSDFGLLIPTPSLPASASASRMSQMSDTISYPTVASTSPTRSFPPSARASPNAQPRKSSPLASSGDAKLWLTRNVRPPP